MRTSSQWPACLATYRRLSVLEAEAAAAWQAGTATEAEVQSLRERLRTVHGWLIQGLERPQST